MINGRLSVGVGRRLSAFDIFFNLNAVRDLIVEATHDDDDNCTGWKLQQFVRHFRAFIGSIRRRA